MAGKPRRVYSVKSFDYLQFPTEAESFEPAFIVNIQYLASSEIWNPQEINTFYLNLRRGSYSSFIVKNVLTETKSANCPVFFSYSVGEIILVKSLILLELQKAWPTNSGGFCS